MGARHDVGTLEVEAAQSEKSTPILTLDGLKNSTVLMKWTDDRHSEKLRRPGTRSEPPIKPTAYLDFEIHKPL